MKKLFICLVSVLFSACQPVPARFTRTGVGDGSLPATPAASPLTTPALPEARIERIGFRDSHAPTPRDVPRSAFAMSTFGEVTLRGWVHSLGPIDSSVAAQFENAAFRLSSTNNKFQLNLTMKREWQGEEATIDLTPGSTLGSFNGTLLRLQMNIEVRCVPQGPEGACDPVHQAMIVIWPKSAVVPGPSHAIFLYQGAEVEGRITGNITPDFDSDVTGQISAVTALQNEGKKRVDLTMDLKTKYGTLVFTAPTGQDRWSLDTEQSNSVYKRRFYVSNQGPAIQMPLDPTSVQLPLKQSTMGFLQATSGNLALTIKR